MYSITIYDRHNESEMENRALNIISVLQQRYNANGDQLFRELMMLVHDLANLTWDEPVDTIF